MSGGETLEEHLARGARARGRVDGGGAEVFRDADLAGETRRGGARAGALDAIKAMDADDFDLAASHRLTADVNFYGEPVVALVVAVEDAAAGDDVPDVRNR